MIGLLELLELAHIKLNTANGERITKVWREFGDTFRTNHGDSDFGGLIALRYFSAGSCGFWEKEESECIGVITEFMEGNESDPSITMIGFFGAWLNNDIQHPIIEELARYFVRNKLFEHSVEITVSEYFEKTKKKPAHRPKNNIIYCLDSLMAYFRTGSINSAGLLLGLDNKTVRERLKRLVGDDACYTILISKDFRHYDSIKQLHESWEVKK
jgi:hypothetical protein